MGKMKKIITLDFDMTIFDSWTRFLEIAKEHYPETVKIDDVKAIKKHGFAPAIEMTNQQIHDVFQRDDFYIDGYFLDGFDELYWFLIEHGFQINILTVGGAKNNYFKSKLMKDVGYDKLTLWSITFMGKTVKFDKGQYDARGGIFVDDRIACLDSVQNAVKFRMSYNGASLTEDECLKYPIIYNMHELREIIKHALDTGKFEED